MKETDRAKEAIVVVERGAVGVERGGDGGGRCAFERPAERQSAATRPKGGSLVSSVWRARRELARQPGQGTVEFAILVGVLVVIALLAITIFRPKIQELWDAIASGINGL